MALNRSATPALLTDRYELTMLDAALASGVADRRATFEVFARALPAGRRYGVVAGTARVVEAIEEFRFDTAMVRWLTDEHAVAPATAEWLAAYRFGGTVVGYPEGELYFPGSPVLTVDATFGEAVLLETLVLSILNHDTAIASAAARMRAAAGAVTLIDMGSRRTHEQAAVDAARAACVAGFDATSNLEAGARYALSTTGTAAHAFTLAHTDERDAFRAQLAQLGTDTTLLVDTFDIPTGLRLAVDAARDMGAAGPGAVRIDSGDLAVETRRARETLDALGAGATRIVVSGDLDEFSIEALEHHPDGRAPIDAYGVGTRLVTGSGAPTAGFVFKLVAIADSEDASAPMRPVAKRSAHKATVGGRKNAYRASLHGTAQAELVLSATTTATARALQVPLFAGGQALVASDDLAAPRARLSASLAELPPGALDVAPGDPALPTLDALPTADRLTPGGVR